MIDQTAGAFPSAPSPSASRRVFRSKVDDLRPTYGFEDVSLAPGTETIEPADVEVSGTLAGLPLAISVTCTPDAALSL